MIEKEKKNSLKYQSSKEIKKAINIQECKIKYFYDQFVLLDKEMFDIFNKLYNFIDSPKGDFIIENNFFIFKHLDNSIEVGKFKELEINQISLFIFKDEKKRNKEIQDLKNLGYEEYLQTYDFIQIDGNSQLNREIDIKIDIDYKNGIKKYEAKKIVEIYCGLENRDNESSLMNSIIELLTSIKEIKEELINNKNNIERFNHIYIVCSFLIKFIHLLSPKKENNQKDKYDLVRKMKVVIDFIEPNLNKKSVRDFLLFFLYTIHDELNKSEKKKEFKILLERFASPLDKDLNKSLSTFVPYYKNFYKSKLSELFHWISKKEKKCEVCNNKSYSFKAFPFIQFDLDKVYNQKPQPSLVNLEDCFLYFLSNSESQDDTEYKEFKCPSCQCGPNHGTSCSIYKSPKYFAFILNTKMGIRCKINEEIILDDYLEASCQYKKYKLKGALIYTGIQNKEEHYIAVIKQNIQWLKYVDEKVDKVDFNSIGIELENSRLLIYENND